MNGHVIFWTGLFIINTVFLVIGDVRLISGIAAIICAFLAGNSWEKS